MLDASAVVRALVDRDPAAVDWLERIAQGAVRASWPALLYAEVASAVLRLHRAGEITPSQAQQVIDAALTAPVSAEAIELLALPAWGVASRRGLTVYDACYVVLAEASDATLVTADRRLAAATPNAVLIAA